MPKHWLNSLLLIRESLSFASHYTHFVWYIYRLEFTSTVVPSIHWFSICGFSYPQFTAAWKKIWKIKEIWLLKFQNVCQVRMGHNRVKSRSPNAPSTWLILLWPHTHASLADLASILLLAFLLFTLVATVLQCLCSESSCLSSKLYRI
jgi:hypothetical protein